MATGRINQITIFTHFLLLTYLLTYSFSSAGQGRLRTDTPPRRGTSLVFFPEEEEEEEKKKKKKKKRGIETQGFSTDDVVR